MAKRPSKASDLPDTVPVFPLSGALLLPHTHRPLNIFEPRYITMVDEVLGKDRLIGLIQPVETDRESPIGRVPLRQIGCLGRIVHFEETDDERYMIMLEGLIRFEITNEIETDAPYRLCQISTKSYAEDFNADTGAEEVDRDGFMAMMREYAEYADIDLDWDEIAETETADLVNFACMMSPYGSAEKQLLLEANTLNARAETLIAITELEIARARSSTTLQ